MLLRHNIIKQWERINGATRTSIQTALLALFNIESRPVRIAVAALIAKVAAVTLGHHKWSELLPFLLNAASSPRADIRELSMRLFGHLAESLSCRRVLAVHAKSLQPVYIRALSDDDDGVRVGGLFAIESLTKIVEGEKKAQLHHTVPPLCDAVLHALQTNRSSDVCTSVFDVLQTFSRANGILDPYLTQVVRMLCAVLQAANIDMAIRNSAAELLRFLINNKPIRIVKTGMLPIILQTVYMLTSEVYNAEDDDDESESPCTAGAGILESLCWNVPKKVIFTPVLSTISEFMSADDIHRQKSGLVMLSELCDGCGELVKPHLDNVMNGVLRQTKSPSAALRTGAWITIGTVADNLLPEALSTAPKVIPVILETLARGYEPATVVLHKAAKTLEVFCVEMSKDDLRPFVPDIMRTLLPLIQINDPELPVGAMGAVSGVAVTMESEFLPYFDTTITMILPMLALTNDDVLQFRCKAIQCCGSFAVAVGAKAFEPYLHATMHSAIDSMQLEYFTLHEHSFNFLQNMVETLQLDFAAYLPHTMKIAIIMLISNDGLEIKRRPGSLMEGELQLDDDTDDDEREERQRAVSAQEVDIGTDDDVEDDDDYCYHITTGAIDEKIAACGFVIAVLKEMIPGEPRPMPDHPLLQHFWDLIKVLETLSGYPNDHIQFSVTAALIFAMQFAAHVEPVPPFRANERIQLGTINAKIIDTIIPLFLERIDLATDRETAGKACEGIATALRLYGLSGIAEFGKALLETIVALFNEQTECQRPTDDRDDDSLERGHDEEFFDEVTDLVEALAATMKEKFEPIFADSLLPLILKYSKSDRIATDRASMIGHVAVVSLEMGSAMTKHLPTLIPMALTALSDTEIAVRRNAAFCAGVLALIGKELVVPYYPDFINALHKLFVPIDQLNNALPQGELYAQIDQFEYDGTVENAVSALCKMITAAPFVAPVSDLLPLIIPRLPFKADYDEVEHVYGCIISLYQSRTDVIAPYTPAVISIFAQVFGNPAVDASLQRDLVAFCQALQANNAAAVQQCVNALPLPLQTQFDRFVNQQQSMPQSNST